MIYLLHFEKPINPDRPAQHYLGYALNLESRLADHSAGRGARITKVALERGIKWQLARTWQGELDTEKFIKVSYRNGRILCPICNPTAYNCCADLDIAPAIQRYRTGRVKISASVAALFNQRRWIFSVDSILKTLNRALAPDESPFTANQIHNALDSKTIRRSYSIIRQPHGWLHVKRINHGN